MALTGNIEVFPLPEVLRLLARSGKNGCLRIDAAGIDGRIYVHEGALSLATVTSDVDFAEQVASSGVVDRERVESHDTVSLPDALAAGRTTDDLTDLVREHVVESLYRIRRPGNGSFEFLVDAEPRFRTGQSFDAEQIVVEADRRAADWAEIERTIADMHLPVRMVRALAEPEVTVNAPTWRVLASLDGGSTIAEISRQLGTTEFRAAREVASLIRAALIEPVPASVAPADSSTAANGQWFSPPAEPEPVDHAPERVSQPEVAEPEPPPNPWATTPPVEEESGPWTVEPWSPPPAPAEPAAEPAVTDETPGEEATASQGGWWADAMGDTGDVEDVDTDQFLESVFSEAEGTGPAEEESGFSMGLLRRRRMGPVARDVLDD